MDFINQKQKQIKTISIDGKGINLLESQEYTLIQICETIDIWLPRFCYHSELSIAGNCRMCLVEINSSPKPVIACATNVNNGSIIKTNTLLIKSIRESILEFLLINHPLDCPICDQGGECDLQDLVIIFGSDRGRFVEPKRSVLDKFFGIMIKTIMTRCIHCTRCIRLSSELLGDPYLGSFGRGDFTEIGTYIIVRQSFSFLLGNLIDICPVGAITSKPYAFRARPWELTKVETVDLLDSLCSSIRVDLKNNTIFRILPTLNPLINDCWISDKVRFSYDSINNQRLIEPMVLNNQYDYIGHSWEFAFFFMKFLFLKKYSLYHKFSNYYLLAGDLLDLFSYNSSILMFSLLGINHLSILSSSKLIKYNDFRNNYIWNLPLSEINNFSFFLFINVSIERELPLLSLKLRKLQLLKKNKFFFYIGNSFNFFLEGLCHLGLSDAVSLGILYGKINFCNLVITRVDLFIMSGIINSKNVVDDAIFFKLLSNLLLTKIEYNYLSLFSSEVNKSELGFFSSIDKQNSFCRLENPALLYLVGFYKKLNINISRLSNLSIIYQGHHGSFNADCSKIILPTTLFFEKSSNFINCEGRLISSTSAIQSAGESWSDELIFYSIFKYFSKLDFCYSNWYDLYFIRFPFIKKNGLLISKKINILYRLLSISYLLIFKIQRHNHLFYSRVYNYYKMDVISHFSKNLLKLSLGLKTQFKSIGNFL